MAQVGNGFLSQCLASLQDALHPALGWWGNPTAPFNVNPKRTFPEFSVGSFTLGLYFWFPESHLPLQPVLAGGPGASVQRLAPGVTSTGTTGAWMGASSIPQLSLSMSHSKVWVTSGAHW